MAPITSRTFLVTLLGAFARRNNGWLPISAIVTLMEAVDVDESSTRTGVSRLKKRNWLDPKKIDGRNGYQLTDLAKQILEAGDQVIWHARQPALLEDGWCIVTFSIPEKMRARRHLLRSRLADLGFGNVGQGVWLATARMAQEACTVIKDLELSYKSNVFVGAHLGGQELSEMVKEAWDLDHIDASYQTFIDRHKENFEALMQDHSGGVPPIVAFRTYIKALDDWRMLPMSDPGLPRELLHPGWKGEQAAKLFEEIVDALDGAAFTFFQESIDQ